MITVVGVGPGALDRVPTTVRETLLDPTQTLVVRTLEHPALSELADLRDLVACDDLYESHDAFGDVYDAIVERVIGLSKAGDVIYAVPGSPLVGEFAVKRLIEAVPEIEIVAGESFVDAVLAEVGYDPLDRGLQILNGHDLPDPLVLDKPTVVGHLDRSEIMADVLDAISRVTVETQLVTVLVGAGAEDSVVRSDQIPDVDVGFAGLRTSLFIDPDPTGLIGAVRVMRQLRAACPWDREQTHQSLVKNLVEESYELIDAIARLEPDDWVTYAEVEDELGDVLLQVLFHAAIARESTAFDIDGVAGVLYEKLVRRHPHVFGDVVANTPEEVKTNWDKIKSAETRQDLDSSLDGVPQSMPALHRSAKIQNRAAKSGFDWDTASEVLSKVSEEVAELAEAMAEDGDTQAELGDLLFSVVNLSRHLGADPEIALRQATAKFESRFRAMEKGGPLQGLTLDQLNDRWEAAKSVEGPTG